MPIDEKKLSTISLLNNRTKFDSFVQVIDK